MDAAALADIDVVLLDIEGTVCPISFVKDVLFPYALKALPDVLEEQWDSPSFAPYRLAFPDEYVTSRSAFRAHFQDLVDRDAKVSYMKALQGYLWQYGYKSGALKAPLFPDVAPFVTEADTAGKKVMIYSSGAVVAQKFLFGHTTSTPSDLRPFISGWYDTVNAGPKTEPASYARIVSQNPSISSSRWLFLSDSLEEVKAALASGMRSLPVKRPGNAPLPSDDPVAKSAICEFGYDFDRVNRA